MTASTPHAISTWDGCDAGQIARICRLPRVELFDEVTSTLDVAHRIAQQGAPGGTLVLANAQSAGRGRFARRWHSERGQGVWMTLIERPADTSALDVLSLRVGLHVAESLDEFAGERVGVKWPNDTAPAVADAAGLPPGTPRAAVLRALVTSVRAAASHVGQLTATELERLASRDVLRGRRIVSPAPGTAAGVDPSGALVIDTPGGAELHRTGTVRLMEEST